MILLITQIFKGLLCQRHGWMCCQFIQRDLTFLLAGVNEHEKKMDQAIRPVKETLEKTFLKQAR